MGNATRPNSGMNGESCRKMPLPQREPRLNDYVRISRAVDKVARRDAAYSLQEWVNYYRSASGILPARLIIACLDKMPISQSSALGTAGDFNVMH